jgi:hypothetical protein
VIEVLLSFYPPRSELHMETSTEPKASGGVIHAENARIRDEGCALPACSTGAAGQVVLSDGRVVEATRTGVKVYSCGEKEKFVVMSTGEEVPGEWAHAMDVEAGRYVRLEGLETGDWRHGMVGSVSGVDTSKGRIRVKIELREREPATALPRGGEGTAGVKRERGLTPLDSDKGQEGKQAAKRRHRSLASVFVRKGLYTVLPSPPSPSFNEVGSPLSTIMLRELVSEAQDYILYLCSYDGCSRPSYVSGDCSLRTWLRSEHSEKPLVRIEVPYYLACDEIGGQFATFWLRLFRLFDTMAGAPASGSPLPLHAETTDALPGLRTRLLDMVDEVLSMIAELYRFHALQKGEVVEGAEPAVTAWRRTLRLLLGKDGIGCIVDGLERGWRKNRSTPLGALSAIANPRGCSETSLELKTLRLKNYYALGIAAGAAALSYGSQAAMEDNAWALPVAETGDAWDTFQPASREAPTFAPQPPFMRVGKCASLGGEGALEVKAAEKVAAYSFWQRRQKWSRHSASRRGQPRASQRATGLDLDLLDFETGDSVTLKNRDLVKASPGFALRPGVSGTREHRWRLQGERESTYVVTAVHQQPAFSCRRDRVLVAASLSREEPTVVEIFQEGLAAVQSKRARTLAADSMMFVAGSLVAEGVTPPVAEGGGGMDAIEDDYTDPSSLEEGEEECTSDDETSTEEQMRATQAKDSELSRTSSRDDKA